MTVSELKHGMYQEKLQFIHKPNPNI